MEPIPRVEMPDRGEGEPAHPAAPVGRAIESVVVNQNRFTVSGEPDIELDPTAADIFRCAEAGEGVFGRTCGGTAMTDHRRQKGF